MTMKLSMLYPGKVTPEEKLELHPCTVCLNRTNMRSFVIILTNLWEGVSWLTLFSTFRIFIRAPRPKFVRMSRNDSRTEPKIPVKTS